MVKSTFTQYRRYLDLSSLMVGEFINHPLSTGAAYIDTAKGKYCTHASMVIQLVDIDNITA